MLSLCRFLVLTIVLLKTSFSVAQSKTSVDICVYGGTSAGVIAAYTAKKMGKSVLLVEPGLRLGGLTSGGLGYTDIGNKYAISALALDFYRRIGAHYGKFEQWIFEPKVAEQLFQEYIKMASVNVLYEHQLKSVVKSGTNVKSILVEHSNGKQDDQIVEAKIFIDCSYEGDLMAKAGVSYKVGREANADYNETYNGVQLKDKHQFLDSIDPYVVKGTPRSGLLWGISPAKLDPDGTGDNKLQSYNFRICLTNDPANKIDITEPEGYDPKKYELLIRVLEREPKRPFNLIMKPDMMPNRKTDINNNGPFSTDMIGMNYEYAEGSFAQRKAIQKEHEIYTKGLLYFIGHDSRIPTHLRDEMLKWGYPKDEYTNNGNWSPQMYIREARRMIGAYVMTQANCQGKEVVNDAVGMAAYTMDSHNCQRVVIEKNGVKMVKNEGDVQMGGFPPYPISYRSLIPKESECTNLYVPVCLSATHIAYGSIRMEPVFMVMAQSAAVAASLAIDSKKPVQQVDVPKLQQILKTNPLVDGSDADIFIDNENKAVSFTGGWKKVDSRSSYASNMLQADNTEKAVVKFAASIPKAISYKVYTYVPKMPNSASTLTLNVNDGKKMHEVILHQKDIKIEGQTSGDWIYVGEYNFSAGNVGFIEITNKNADGITIADAVLLVASKKK